MLLRDLFIVESGDDMEDAREDELYRMFNAHKAKMSPEQVAYVTRMLDKYESALENDDLEHARDAFGDLDEYLCQFEAGEEPEAGDTDNPDLNHPKYPTADGGIG
jgi:hypothetical protein